ncbi:MAG: hypothetical protein U0230_22080 [Polyangiales bacterium]
MSLLLAKLLIAPSFVAGVSLVGRRFGPKVAGFVAALPVVGGPILGLLVAEQGPVFGARAALAGSIGAAPTMVFALVYAHLASRLAWGATLGLAYTAYFAATALLSLAPTNAFTAIAIPLATWALSLRAFPRASASGLVAKPSAFDLPVRIVATMTLVVAITTLARILGPERSGLLTPFPIATAVLAVFAHREAGGGAAAVLLRALVRGLFSFCTFFVVIGFALPSVGAVPAFALGGLAALCVHVVMTLRS